MKKVFLALLASLIVFCSVVFIVSSKQKKVDAPFRVAMITSFSDIDDNSFNQSTYEGCKEWCDAHKIPFNYYKPVANSTYERAKSTELAIDRGHNVIFLPGYEFGEIISYFAPKYPDVTFFGIDLTENDIFTDHSDLKNVFCFSYQEEIAGYLAGYAAVKEGYKNLGFLGGMKGNGVTRFGYGYVQGVDSAAQELNVNTTVNFVYGGQFFGDNDITKYIDNWYKGGTEVVFSCGGGIFTSASLAAKDNGGKVIGVDTDQSIIINKNYGEGRCITSAIKGIGPTIKLALDAMLSGDDFDSKFYKLGLVSSENLEKNFVGLPIKTWSMKNFTIDDYKKVVGELIDEKRTVSNDITKIPTLSSHTEFIDLGSIK